MDPPSSSFRHTYFHVPYPLCNLISRQDIFFKEPLLLFLQVWAHLIGLYVKGKEVKKVNKFAGVPNHYEALIKRYEEIFTVSFFRENNFTKFFVKLMFLKE